MAVQKRRGKAKQAPTISNTGFIGSVFVDTSELRRKQYYFSRKKLHVAHHVLDGLAQAASHLFVSHGVLAYLSCVYMEDQQKIGFVLSSKPFQPQEGRAYFKNYLLERNFYAGAAEVDFEEVFNTGFLGVVFADLSGMLRYTFDIEMNILVKLMKDMMIPVKELFLRNRITAYLSSVELEDQEKLGFVLSVKPYDEKAEAELYFQEYLRERGFYLEEEDELEQIVIRRKIELL
ncbi:hypothetical protein [Ectobacillus ponti]|uniref:Uncharacterized protein n=1 Tax=Ectobacillus ponti TaxID=2961894 RepID=A0AA42BUR8_9BACI|nr:hypothetical protein [Ectobacillus ponti]MCP8970798.1 hypothetical protein [Ectobacillus ponti]